MDVTFIDNNYQFLLRTSAIILNKDKSKILLFKVKNKDFYLLPGGKIKRLNDSLSSLKREMKEELGLDYSNIDFKFIGISEEFVNDKKYNNQQINIIYKGIYENDIKNNIFNGLEGNWIIFEWIDIKTINDITVYPNIKDAIDNNIFYSNCNLLENGDKNGII